MIFESGRAIAKADATNRALIPDNTTSIRGGPCAGWR
jgi:hypothetical protein